MTTRRGPGPGQLALFGAQPRTRRPRRTPTHWPRWHRDGRRITTLPDIATYQETQSR
ncbi:hypothetical protein HUF15_00665 [Streptomyces samsunensis]|uniref:hypothetical protein n=1 Tax=Streptomyces malaysiensis TaxID=92644 RepID=UPI001581A2E7|nr:hypothetical protein [Streptomyces samsunensis]NUH35293.1 hypothetical protein [Streptomyces samsunensis]